MAKTPPEKTSIMDKKIFGFGIIPAGISSGSTLLIILILVLIYFFIIRKKSVQIPKYNQFVPTY